MHTYEINLCCPRCGAYEWESTETDTFVCTECSERSTPAEMEPHYFET